MLQKMLWLSLAGACGTLSRYSICEFTSKTRLSHLPLGTFAVNMLGCFLFGLIYALSEKRVIVTPDTRVYLLVGFMGAFTTFSTFAFDTAKMMRASQWALAAGNVLAQTCLGVLALGIGVIAVRALSTGP